jgi:hypothetical protein
MKQLKITPLIVTAALIMSWAALRISSGELNWTQGGLLTLLLISVLAADQIFRIFLKKTTQIWLIEGVFVLLVALIIWILRTS